MLRQATIEAGKNGKSVRLSVLHDRDHSEFAGGAIHLQVNGGQPITVNADDLREAIADVLPKVAE